jgi:hypothetical protein
VRDIETIDAELRLVATLRCAARERGGPLPSIDVADALLDERNAANPLWQSHFQLFAEKLPRPLGDALVGSGIERP